MDITMISDVETFTDCRTPLADTIEVYTIMLVNSLARMTYRTPEGAVAALHLDNYRVMGDITCDCTKVPPGLPFVSNVQSKTHQDSLPAVTASSAEEMETNEDDMEFPPGA